MQLRAASLSVPLLASLAVAQPWRAPPTYALPGITNDPFAGPLETALAEPYALDVDGHNMTSRFFFAEVRPRVRPTYARTSNRACRCIVRQKPGRPSALPRAAPMRNTTIGRCHRPRCWALSVELNSKASCRVTYWEISLRFGMDLPNQGACQSHYEILKSRSCKCSSRYQMIQISAIRYL